MIASRYYDEPRLRPVRPLPSLPEFLNQFKSCVSELHTRRDATDLLVRERRVTFDGIHDATVHPCGIRAVGVDGEPAIIVGGVFTF